MSFIRNKLGLSRPIDFFESLDKYKFINIKKNTNPILKWFILLLIVYSSMGFITLSVTLLRFNDSSIFINSLKKEGMISIIGLIISVFLYYINIKFFFYKRFSLDFIFKFINIFFKKDIIPFTNLSFTIIQMIALLIWILTLWVSVLGQSLNGAKRWLFIGGISIQPSELIKIFLPFFITYIFIAYQKKLERNNKNFKIYFKILFIIMLYIFPVAIEDVSTSLLLIGITFVILMVYKIPKIYFVIIIAIGIILLGLAVSISPNRLGRLLAFINPTAYPDLSYQLNRSHDILKEVSIFGNGLSNSVISYFSIPEIENDFIFISYAHIGGFLGVILFLIIFTGISYLGYLCIEYKRKERPLYYKLGLGLLVVFCVQVVTHLLVVIGFFPTTGLSLPFFSLGGTSRLLFIILFGVFINLTSSKED